MENVEQPITIFYSWQSVSDNKTNRNFIEDCLKKSVKEVTKTEHTPIIIDRDTKGVGGTPEIFNEILKKIRSCDVFICDLTIIHDKPRHSPNANVLIELGYALSIVGGGRILCVMNTGNGIGPEHLPFDMQNKRHPLQYNYSIPNNFITYFNKLRGTDVAAEKSLIKQNLAKDLAGALRDAIKEPKTGAILSDVDFHIGRVLWDIINSDWIRVWTEEKRRMIQYDRREYHDKMFDYCDAASKPENHFINEKVSAVHDDFIRSLNNYLSVSSTVMVRCDGNDNMYVIGIKDRARRQGWIDDYDEIYDKQVDTIRKIIDPVEAAWNAYVYELRSKYPEITHAPS